MQARGFLFTPVSIKLGVPFVMLRKAWPRRSTEAISVRLISGRKVAKHDFQWPVHEGAATSTVSANMPHTCACANVPGV